MLNTIIYYYKLPCHKYCRAI